MSRWNGVLNIECGENCLENRHLLIELDYERSPYLWGILINRHQSFEPQLKAACDDYLTKIDDESTFFLIPLPRSRKLYMPITAFVAAVYEEVEEIEREDPDVGEEHA